MCDPHRHQAIYILTDSIVHVVGLISTAAEESARRIAVYRQRHDMFIVW